MQDRTPDPAPSDNPTWGIDPVQAAAEDQLAAGLTDENLPVLFRAAYERGQDWIMGEALRTVEAARTLPDRVAAGIRWLLTHPVAEISDEDPVRFVQDIAYHQAVRLTVETFMAAPSVQRDVAALFAPGPIPAPRGSSDRF